METRERKMCRCAPQKKEELQALVASKMWRQVFQACKKLPSQHNSLSLKYFQFLTFLMVGLSLKWVHFRGRIYIDFKCLDYSRIAIRTNRDWKKEIGFL